MELWSREGRAVILNPARGFEPEIQVLEYRRDPLTGRLTVVARGRSGYVMRSFRSDEALVRELVEATAERCPFCPGALEERTPKFPPEVAPEGRLRVGDCWAVPALFAHMDFNAIIILGRQHFRRLHELSADLLRDGLSVGVEVIRRAHRAYPHLNYATIVMNYMPTGGASQPHPHMQALASPEPFNRVRELLARSLEYHRATSGNFWADLVEREAEEGSRLVGHVGRTWWLVPFAPERRYEVWCLVEGASSLLELASDDLAQMAGGLARVLRFYSDMGILAFNMAILSGPLDGSAKDYFWLQMRICARFGLSRPFLSDFWALSALLDTDEVFEAPEDYAARLRPYLSA